MIGPEMLCRKSRMVAESYVRPSSGFGGTQTLYPSCWSRLTTPFQLELSAQAPCTSTMLGLAAL
jgi:hypothetical protein